MAGLSIRGGCPYLRYPLELLSRVWLARWTSIDSDFFKPTQLLLTGVITQNPSMSDIEMYQQLCFRIR